MDKLLNLLNQFCEESGKEYRFKEIVDSDFFVIDESKGLGYETILCKKFLFVKWLVENDKIDRHNVKETNYGWEFNYYWTIPNSKRNKEIQVERLLMLLAIQENPTEFLVSVLI